MARLLRKGVGELVGAAILAIIIFYALMFWYYSTIINLTNYVEGELKSEIYYAEEKLLVLPPRNNTITVIGQWKGPSAITAVVCGYGTRNPRVIKLSNPIGIEPWRATSIELPPSCEPTICVFTAMGNLFCNVSIPTKIVTMKPAIIIANKWLRIVPNYVEIPLNISTSGSYDVVRDDGYYHVDFKATSRIDSGGTPLLILEGPARVVYGGINLSIEVSVSASVKSAACVGEDCAVEITLRSAKAVVSNGSSSISVEPLVLARKCYTYDPASCDIHWSPLRIGENALVFGRLVNGKAFAVLRVGGVELNVPIDLFSSARKALDLSLAAIALGSNSSTGLLCSDLCRELYALSSEGPNVSRAILEELGLPPLPPASSFGTEVSIAVLNSSLRELATFSLRLLDLGESQAAPIVLRFGTSTSFDPPILTLGTVNSLRSWSGDFDKLPPIDLRSAWASPALLLAMDSEGRYELAIAKPLQIVVTSTRRVAGYAQPGNLTLVATVNGRTVLSKTIEINNTNSFDLNQNLPATNASIALDTKQQVATPWHTTIETITKLNTEIHHAQPPPPPSTPPPPPPNPPLPTPKVWIEYYPKPNSSKPVAITVEAHVVEKNIDPSRYSALFEIEDVDSGQWRSQWVDFSKIGPDEIVATMGIPGDHRYRVFVIVFEDNDEIAWGGAINYRG